jgi:hypothetical protein
MTRESLLETLAPALRAIHSLDLSDPESAARALDAAFPASWRAPVGEALRAARDAGWLTPKSASERVRFGRLARPSAETHGLSVDAVDMTGPAAPHTHPNGEVSLCFADAPGARFCGRPEGWVVVPPGSHHTPETDGPMLIVYFLPEGAMVWDT